jgi:hypothetical protein
MRYRLASSVPGTNRVSEREEEDVRRDEPLDGVLEAERGVAGTEAATVRVAKTSAPTFCPQVEQKRLFSLISLAQDGHLIMTDAFHDPTPVGSRAALKFPGT